MGDFGMGFRIGCGFLHLPAWTLLNPGLETVNPVDCFTLRTEGQEEHKMDQLDS